MANRRMFSKSITNSSQFLMMPQSSQNLYFHLGMNADDDGFCEHFSIMRMTDSKPDDLKVLQAKGFVSIFDDKVLVIVDWKENNYLRNDRYTPSKYLQIYKQEMALLSRGVVDTIGIPEVNQVDTQVRLGKVRLGEDNTCEQDSLIPKVIDLFSIINPAYKKWFANKSQRAACKRLLDTHGLEQLGKVIAILPKTNSIAYMPSIQTPIQLEDKWSQLESALKKKKLEVTSKGRGLA